jgi:hypothetical protein
LLAATCLQALHSQLTVCACLSGVMNPETSQAHTGNNCLWTLCRRPCCLLSNPRRQWSPVLPCSPAKTSPPLTSTDSMAGRQRQRSPGLADRLHQTTGGTCLLMHGKAAGRACTCSWLELLGVGGTFTRIPDPQHTQPAAWGGPAAPGVGSRMGIIRNRAVS